MPLDNLARALPGLLVAVVLTGYALATVVAPRWRTWERLAAAPGLSAGFFGVLGLTMRLVHVPFEPQTVLPAVALLVGAALLRRRRARAADRGDVPWWVCAPALVAGAVAAGVFAAALSSQVLPPDWDPRVHGALAAAIARSHDVLPLFPIPLEGTAFAYARPGFEAMAAVVSWVGGPSPADAMTPVIACVLLLLPLGLTLLALEATGSLGLAMLVPLVAAGMAFPSIEAIVGRFPQVVDSTLVVPLIVAAMRLVRGRRPLDNALLLVAATASVWVVHGLEVLTAGVIGGALLAWTAAVELRRVGAIALARGAAAALAVAAGAALVTVLTRLPQGPTPTATEPSIVPVPPPSAPVRPHEILQWITQADLVSPLAMLLLVVGVVAIVVRGRMLWVLVAQALVLLGMADSLYWRHLGTFWRHTVFPYGDVDRLLGLEYWILPFIVAAGLLALAGAMRGLARRPRAALAASMIAVGVVLVAVAVRHSLAARYTDVFAQPAVSVPPLGVFDGLAHLGPWRVPLLVAGVVSVLAWGAQNVRGDGLRALAARLSPAARLDAAAALVAVLGLIALALGARAELAIYDRGVDLRGTATSADLAVLHSMSAQLPRGTLVLTDELDDAGIWLASFTDLAPLVPPSSEGGALSLPLVSALSNACTAPGPAEAALQDAGAVFVGAHHIPGSPNLWDATCLARLPELRQIASASSPGGEAVGFIVVR